MDTTHRTTRTTALLAHGAFAGVAALVITATVMASSVTLTPALRAEYLKRWASMAIQPAHRTYTDARIDRISHFEDQYKVVSKATGVPWYVIAVIDEMEGGGGCAHHLHNGDSLKHRTVHVPAGRPRAGSPPFTWYASALDALAYDDMDSWHDWTLTGTLYKLEGFNGFGYRHASPHAGNADARTAGVSPYLWSFATVPGWNGKGKYTSDGGYSRTAVSDQIGAAVLLRRLVDRKLIAFPPEARSP